MLLPLRFAWNHKILSILTSLVLVILTGVITWHNQDEIAAKSHKYLGDDFTFAWERRLSPVIDRVKRTKFELVGGDTRPKEINPEGLVFGGGRQYGPPVPPPQPDPISLAIAPQEVAPEPISVPAWAPPPVTPFQPDRNADEGIWSPLGLPNPNWRDPVMMATFLLPDKARPYSVVRILAIDSKHTQVHLANGWTIPTVHYPYLLGAWSGAFRLSHGISRMTIDGAAYVGLPNGGPAVKVAGPPTLGLVNGVASFVVDKYWNVNLGVWGRDFTWSDDMVSVRQNSVLLVDNCQVTQVAKTGGTSNWGQVADNDTTTLVAMRSGLGITANGDLLVAVGNDLTPVALASALQAAGACRAMLLDMNGEWVMASLFYLQDNGSIKSEKLYDKLNGNPGRYLTGNYKGADFMYLTLDELRNP